MRHLADTRPIGGAPAGTLLRVASNDARPCDAGPAAVPFDSVWIDMDAAAVERNHCWTLLSSDEQARSRDYRFGRDAARYIVRRGYLRALLGERLGCPPREIVLRADAFGKLSVPGSTLSFNLSHSQRIALYAFAWGRGIGCDLEWRDPAFDCERTAERFFTPAEARVLRVLPRAARNETFFTCWTRKEAYLKGRGLGLSIPLDSFAVILSSDQSAAVVAGDAGWSLISWELLPDYQAAVAVEL